MMAITSRFGLAAFALGLALVAVPACAETLTYAADLKGGDEVPANDSKGTGKVTATYDTATKTLTWKVEYSGLTGPAAAAHFHGPADPGKNADPVVPLTGAMDSPMQGSAVLTDDQAKEFADGKVYFNIHTGAHKGGEIRGQVMKAI
jgi:CHRD domain